MGRKRKRKLNYLQKVAVRRNWLFYRLKGAIAHVKEQIAAMEYEGNSAALVCNKEYLKLCEIHEELEYLLKNWKAGWNAVKACHLNLTVHKKAA